MVIFLCRKRILVVALACAILFGGLFPIETYGEDGLSMYSGSYALTDAATGRVLTGKNETNPMANASTTKILTCIVALENCDLNETVTISSNAAAQPRVRLGVQKGETYPLEDMLYALMLESYNDCAVAIAEHVAGSVEGFAEMMNKKALEIGCKDTYFITPNGLDEETENNFHHTTAEDLCKIMAYCVWESPRKDIFLEITQTRSYNGFVNRNSFLDQMDGVVSGKTGFTSKAGYCYVAAFERDGEKYCIALLACGWPNNKTYKWKDATKLLNYGMENYTIEKIEAEEIVEGIAIDGYVGEMDFQNINQDMTLRVSGVSDALEVLMAEDEAIQREIVLFTDEELPIENGQVMGVCNYYIEGILLDSVYLVAEADSGQWTLEKIIKMIMLEFLTFSSQSGL